MLSLHLNYIRIQETTMTFQDKTVWITGASSGIGEALAYEFARQGANLVLSARNTEALEKVKNNCPSGINVIIQKLDISDFDSINGIAENVIQKAGRIDILVNNAGISQRSLVKDTNFEVYQRLINVNLLGTICLTKAVLPHFIYNQSGHFVVLTSITGKFATPLRSGYAAAKHGLHGFFDALRLESYSDNIKVTLTTPGFVKTNISINALTADGSKQNTMDAGQASGLLPSELAKMLVRDIKKGKRETVYGGLKERAALMLKRFAPSLLERALRNMSVR